MSIERKILLSLDVDKITDLIEKSSKELGKALLQILDNTYFYSRKKKCYKSVVVCEIYPWLKVFQ